MAESGPEATDRPGEGGGVSLEMCRSIPTGTWSDALDLLGIDGVLDGLTRQAGVGRIAGTAVTVLEAAAVRGTYQSNSFDVGPFIDAVGPGQVLVISMIGQERVSTLGGLAARRLIQGRVEGVVIDGGCRDIEDVRQQNLHVTSRFVTPRSGKSRVRVVELAGAIDCGGIIVNPADWIIVDDTGAVCVPSSRIEETIALASTLATRDADFSDRLERGQSFTEVARTLNHV
jgi:regulator of RNase E activity RraA